MAASSIATTPTGAGSRLGAMLLKTGRDFFKDDIPSVAAGVTFYALLALFPGLSAMMSLYGLFADVGDVGGHVRALEGLLPGGAVSVLGDELRRLAQAEHAGLSLTFAASLAISLWSANAGVRALLKGLTTAYEARERRGAIVLTLNALALTIGAVAFGVCILAVVASAPALLARLGVDAGGGFEVIKWPMLLGLLVGGLSILYRLGVDRRHGGLAVLPGAVAAAVGWTAMSLGFSWYVAYFGQFDRTFGTLGAVAGFMTWIWLSMMVVLAGAELNAAIEAGQEAACVAHPPEEPRPSRGV